MSFLWNKFCFVLEFHRANARRAEVSHWLVDASEGRTILEFLNVEYSGHVSKKSTLKYG